MYPLIKNTKKELLLAIGAILLFSLTVAVSPLSAAGDSTKYLDNLSRDQTMQYGSNYLIDATFNDSLSKEKENAVDAKNRVLEEMTINKKVATPTPEYVDLKGPRGDGGSGVKGEVLVKTVQQDVVDNNFAPSVTEPTPANVAPIEVVDTPKEIPQPIIDFLNSKNNRVKYDTVYSGGKYKVIWSECEDGIYNIYIIKEQIFDSNAEKIGEERVIGSGRGNGGLDKVTMLPNGNTAVIWWTLTADLNHVLINMQFLDQDGESINSEEVFHGGSVSYYYSTYHPTIYPIVSLSNGNLAVIWLDNPADWVYYVPTSLRVRFFNQNGKTIGQEHPLTANTRCSLDSVANLPDGNIALFWTEAPSYTYNPTYSLKAQSFNNAGEKIEGERILAAFGPSGTSYKKIDLPNGNIAVFWRGAGKTPGSSALHMQIFKQNGEEIEDKKEYIFPDGTFSLF